MAKITVEEVRRIAELSRLKMTDEELQDATKDLRGILNHFSAIQAINTDGVPMADDVSGLVNVSRADVAEPEALASHAALLDGVPEKEDGLIKVKAVFN